MEYQATNEYLNTIRKEISKALESVGKDFGVEFKAGGITYDANGFEIKIKAARTDKDVAREQFENAARLYGFNPSAYNKTFNSQGRQYTIVGFDPKKKSYPVIARTENGEEFGFRITSLMDKGIL